MMGYGGYGGMMGNAGLFATTTWVVLLVFLILGSVFFWKQINKKK